MIRVGLNDTMAGLRLLSRLPVGTTADPGRGAAAVWAYPVAGGLIGAVAALAGSLALGLGLSPVLAAGLIVALQVIATGAMHEDGLADSADGLWGGWDRDRRLAIMRDSRIGTYGVIALALGLGLRWQALALLIDTGGLWGVLIGTAALSRVGMVAVMAALPHARDDGLSRSVGRPEAEVAWQALAAGSAIGFLTLGFAVLPVLLVGAALVWGLAQIARAKIDGQTGDILGATQQISEIGILLVLCALA